jgi:predicted molibdopterin-dependent oxidoreductase YjgC
MGRSFFALQIAAFQDGSTGWATTIVPASATTEKEGTVTNLEGRVQRLRAAVPPPAGVPDGLAWAGALAERLGLSVPASTAGVFAEMAAGRPAFAGMTWSTVGEHSEEATATHRPEQAPPVSQLTESMPPSMTVVGYRQLHSGPASDHAPLLHFQRRNGIEIAYDDAQSLGVASGDRVKVEFDGRSVSGGAVVNRRLRPGVVRLAADPPYVGPAGLSADEEQADA